VMRRSHCSFDALAAISRVAGGLVTSRNDHLLRSMGEEFEVLMTKTSCSFWPGMKPELPEGADLIRRGRSMPK
jgi:hypothetical protein